jgi:hypothetical protein
MVVRCLWLFTSIGRFVSDDSLGQRGNIQLNPTENMMNQWQIGNAVLHFEHGSNPVSYGRLKKLKQTIREEVCKSDFITGLSRNLLDFDCPGDGLISSMIEQTPNLKSRIFLGPEIDMFGMRRVKLDWQANENDYKTIRTWT